MPYSHIAFSDEAYTHQGRYRSIALLTLARDDLHCINVNAEALLKESNVDEFKWHELDSAKVRFAAVKLLDLAITWATHRKLRVDVLIWDMEDSRHKDIYGRDDNENFVRMYYHLLSNVLRWRWPDGATWKLCPDENSIVDWSNLQDILNRVGQWGSPRREQMPLVPSEDLPSFSVAEIAPVVSCQTPLCQVADLFAGMAAFSYEKSTMYQSWLSRDQPMLPGFQTDAESLSRSDRERSEVLKHFSTECGKITPGVSLKSSQGLRTRDPNKPLNFWLYQPQRPEDKAPKRDSHGYV